MLTLVFPSLVKIPELQENMFQLATEMERAGLVEEIVSDGLALTDVRCVTVLFVDGRIFLLTVRGIVSAVHALVVDSSVFFSWKK